MNSSTNIENGTMSSSGVNQSVDKASTLSSNNLPSTTEIVEEFFQSSVAEKVAEATALTLICSVAVVANVSLWLVVLRTRSLRTESNMLILCLSLADLMVSTVSMPVTIATIIAARWQFSSLMCTVVGYLNMLTFTTSVQSLGAISINRYVKICRPNKYQDIYTYRNVAVMCVGVWSFSALLSIPPLLGWGMYDFLPLASICFCAWNTSASYAMFMIGACFCLPCVAMVICYTAILRAFFKSRRTIESFDADKHKKEPRADDPDMNERDIHLHEHEHNRNSSKIVFIGNSQGIITEQTQHGSVRKKRWKSALICCSKTEDRPSFWSALISFLKQQDSGLPSAWEHSSASERTMSHAPNSHFNLHQIRKGHSSHVRSSEERSQAGKVSRCATNVNISDNASENRRSFCQRFSSRCFRNIKLQRFSRSKVDNCESASVCVSPVRIIADENIRSVCQDIMCNGERQNAHLSLGSNKVVARNDTCVNLHLNSEDFEKHVSSQMAPDIILSNQNNLTTSLQRLINRFRQWFSTGKFTTHKRRPASLTKSHARKELGEIVHSDQNNETHRTLNVLQGDQMDVNGNKSTESDRLNGSTPSIKTEGHLSVSGNIHSTTIADQIVLEHKPVLAMKTVNISVTPTADIITSANPCCSNPVVSRGNHAQHPGTSGVNKINQQSCMHKLSRKNKMKSTRISSGNKCHMAAVNTTNSERQNRNLYSAFLVANCTNLDNVQDQLSPNHFLVSNDPTRPNTSNNQRNLPLLNDLAFQTDRSQSMNFLAVPKPKYGYRQYYNHATSATHFDTHNSREGYSDHLTPKQTIRSSINTERRNRSNGVFISNADVPIETNIDGQTQSIDPDVGSTKGQPGSINKNKTEQVMNAEETLDYHPRVVMNQSKSQADSIDECTSSEIKATGIPDPNISTVHTDLHSSTVQRQDANNMCNSEKGRIIDVQNSILHQETDNSSLHIIDSSLSRVQAESVNKIKSSKSRFSHVQGSPIDTGLSLYRVDSEVVRKRQQSVQGADKRRREEYQLSASLLVVIVIFIICWFPYCISMFVSIYSPSASSRGLDLSSLILGYLNSCVNPIVYGLMNRRFKTAYKQLYRCYGCMCKKRRGFTINR